MLDIKFVRENPELVKENIKKKFQEHKLILVDEVLELDEKNRAAKLKGDELRSSRNSLSSQIGNLMKNGEKDKAEEIKKQVATINAELVENEKLEASLAEEIKTRMMKIPNIMHESVPVGEDDSKNVEVQKYGEPVVPDYEIPYHADIMESFCGIDLDSARRVAGNGFYYLMGDVARLHSAVISYARDFMINKGFTYCIPPFMIRSDVVTGVMSFEEMDAMMYKIEGEDLYLIGTSEHSMIGKFKDQILQKADLPYTMTSYSPCFRKEKGAHGIEERGIYRIHQFEKQEMIVVCEPENSYEWYDKMWSYTVELFRSLDVPVRTLECCSGDLADLKAKSVDVEAWSPRQQKYFEVGSCSNLTDAQARRLGIRVKGEKGNYYAHTLNNTVVAPPRMLIALLENNYNADGSVNIPKVLQPYMGGMEVLVPNKNKEDVIVIVKNPKFEISAVSPKQYPVNGLPEIVLVGKSNVGKSSFVNTMINRKALARTSSEPGKTRQINFYNIDDKFYFVDLPGYGYSKMSKLEQEKVGKFTEEYLVKRNTISLIIFLIDIRHKPTENDRLMYHYVMKSNLPFMVLANKADKIAPTKVDAYVEDMKKELGISFSTILPFSSERKVYSDAVWENIEKIVMK